MLGKIKTPPVVENRDSSTDKNSGSQKETKNSTTIINETVNNNAKGNNILLMTLTSLSASVTIIGGIIAFVRHLRGRGKKKNPVSKAQSSKNGKTPSNSMTAEPSVSSKKTPNEEKVLTETQQINMQADELLKNHKKTTKRISSQKKIKKPFKVFYFAQIFEKLSVKFTDSFYFKDCDNEGDKLFEVATLKFSKV